MIDATYKLYAFYCEKMAREEVNYGARLAWGVQVNGGPYPEKT